jgi:hypothetical protein
MNGLEHQHQCPACGTVRDCEVMIDRFEYVRPCWTCVRSGLATWPPVKAQA